MKSFYFILILIITSSKITAQTLEAQSAGQCKTYQESLIVPDEKMINVLKLVLAPIGIPPNFLLYPCPNINNCVAKTVGNYRYIFYDPKYLDALVSKKGSGWVELFIFAHEIGHHLCGHTTRPAKDIDEQREYEIEADKYGGFILAKLNATLAQTLIFVSNLPDPDNPKYSTHPLRKDRITAVTTGYYNAKDTTIAKVFKLLDLTTLSNSTEAILFSAFDNYYSNNTNLALTEFKKIYHKDSTFTPAISGLALTYAKLNSFDNSDLYLSHIHKVTGNNFDYFQLQNQIDKKRESASLVSKFSKEIASDPTNAALYYKRANIYKELGDEEKYQIDLKKSFDLGYNFSWPKTSYPEKKEKLNTAYYALGTAKELTKNGVLTKEGGFIGLGKTQQVDFTKAYFTKVDIPGTNSIIIGAKKAKLITNPPIGSYKIEGENGNADKLTILNSKEFWSVSKYLVIVIE